MVSKRCWSDEFFMQETAQKKPWTAWLMAAAYFLAGINHFRAPEFYLPLIPDYLGHKILLNNLSGVAEVVLGLGLIHVKSRRYAAWGIMAMLVAFLPAHIWFIQKGGCLDPNGLCVPVWVAWVRLLVVHPLLLWWAYRCCKTTTASL